MKEKSTTAAHPLSFIPNWAVFLMGMDGTRTILNELYCRCFREYGMKPELNLDG